MYKVIIILIILVSLASCFGDKKLKKNTILQKSKKIDLYNLNIDKFPRKELLLNDVNFIAYVNLKEIKRINFLKEFISILADKYFIRNIDSFYLTFNDIYKSQEFLLFLDKYQIKAENKTLEREKIAKKLLFKVKKTDNQEFGFINFENNTSLYGDIALIKELFNIHDKKVGSISEQRYNIFANSNFLKSNAEFKLFFMPNAEYRKMILEFSEKQALFEVFTVNLNYIFLEVKLQDDNMLKINLTISKKESINKLFTFLTLQHKLLLTLKGAPYSTLNTKEIMQDISLFKLLKINKIDDNSLLISITINHDNLKKYFNLIKSLTK